MKEKAARNFLLFLLVFLGIGALGGGAGMILSPSGESMGLPLSMLDGSPFQNFLIPGVILFTILGICPILLVYALLKKPESKFAEKINFYKDMHWSWSFSIYIAFALIIWLQVQMVITGVHWLHTFYMFYAVVLIITALLPQVRSLYRK